MKRTDTRWGFYRGGPAAVLSIAMVLCLLAWWLPAAKDGAVAGRLSYGQLWLALLAAVASLALAVLAIAPPPARFAVSFRLLAVGLAMITTLAAWELGTFLWSVPHLMDNPWYLATGEGLEPDLELRFVRGPGIEWTGLSVGDLATRAGDRDPDARVVTFRTDFEGFRNPQDLTRAELVFLGDSFTEAGNVPEAETFAARVGRGLGSTVRNLGRAGYSAPSELVVLKTYAVRNQPRRVVWQIAESNDLLGAERYQKWLDGGRKDFKRQPRGRPTRVEAWKRRSPSYRVFEVLRRPMPWPLGGEFVDRHGEGHEVRFLPYLPGRRHQPLLHPGWSLTVKAIEAGAEMLRQEGIELLVLLLPMKLRVMGPYVRFHPAELEARGETWRFEGGLPEGWDLPPEETLAFHLDRLCSRLGVVFVDATPRLKQAAAVGEIVYLPLDTHLSSRGHEVVADILLEALR